MSFVFKQKASNSQEKLSSRNAINLYYPVMNLIFSAQ